MFTITIFSAHTDQGIHITRYDRPGRDTNEYKNVTASSLARLFIMIRELKAYHTETPPHWTSYTLIKDPIERNHFANLHAAHKQPGRKWEINAEIYNEFLGMLPPLAYKHDGFYMREFVKGQLTTRYSREASRYYCEFAIYPPAAARPSLTSCPHCDKMKPDNLQHCPHCLEDTSREGVMAR